MCLAVPMRIESTDGPSATVSAAGTSLNVNVSFLDGASKGDYVLVHAGFAIKKIDEAEAEETIRLLNEMARHSKESER